MCWPDNRNLEKKMQRTRKLVQKEKQNKILKSTKKNDGIAFHHHQTGHTIDFANTKILGEEKSYWRRLITEGLEIKKLPITKRANMQSGYEIDPCWDDILKIQGT